jgi:hypothetical protein
MTVCFQRFKDFEVGRAVIDFPIKKGLDMSKYVVLKNENENPTYDLYAVVNHYGNFGGGHYTAMCLNPETNKWYEFDDSSVSEIRD